MTMTYELGTSVFNMVFHPTMCEEMSQSDSNRFVQAEFPTFPPNSADKGAQVMLGEPHGWFDLRHPAPDQQGILDPYPLTDNLLVSFWNTTGQQGNLIEIIVPPLVSAKNAPPPPKCTHWPGE